MSLIYKFMEFMIFHTILSESSSLIGLDDFFFQETSLKDEEH